MKIIEIRGLFRYAKYRAHLAETLANHTVASNKGARSQLTGLGWS